MLRVLQIGRLPDNAGIGGVTLHVSRLLYHLRQGGVNAELCDYKTASLFEQLKMVVRTRIIHVHISHPALRFLYVVLACILRKRIVLTIHGNLDRFGPIYNMLDRASIVLSSVPVLLNENSYSKSIQYNGNSQLLSAFLPPLPDEVRINDTHLNLIRTLRNQYKKLYITNAYKRVFDDEKNEIYGISFLIKNFKKLHDSCLVISDPSGENAQQYAKDAPENIKFIDVPHSFFALIALSDGIIRSTSTDGDSLTIREGLYCGVPVIATNCVARPDGCILFNYGDSEGFFNALEQMTKTHLIGTNANQNVNCIDKYIKIYKELTN